MLRGNGGKGRAHAGRSSTLHARGSGLPAAELLREPGILPRPPLLPPRFPLSIGQLYDAWIQHGEGNGFADAGGMMEAVRKQLGGTPKTGVDEKLWLDAFLTRRWGEGLGIDQHGDQTGDQMMITMRGGDLPTARVF